MRLQEPVLLVGETGSGKTTLLQHLADQVSSMTSLTVSSAAAALWPGTPSQVGAVVAMRMPNQNL